MLKKSIIYKTFQIIKSRLRSEIESLKENPVNYSLVRTLEEMYPDSISSKSVLGSIEELESYKRMIESKTEISSIEILKIERPKYEVVEEKKELLTEEDDGTTCWAYFRENYFKGLEIDKEYDLSELSLEKEYCECCGVEITKENKALDNMCNECKYGLEDKI